jgi:UDPglucose 6-dehydrogenase
MHITVIGSGYVGLVTGAGLADLGLVATCVDKDQEKIRMLQQGSVPIYEPGLEDLVRRNQASGRLRFSGDLPGAVRSSLVNFIAVGTDAGEDGTPDMSQVSSVTDSIADCMDEYKVIVLKSTVPVGTSAQVEQRIRARLGGRVEFDVAANPEFLREGAAVEDFFHPSRIVIGTRSDRAAAIMKDLYRALYLIQTPFVMTSWECAELIKHAANSFLAVKISFINEIANLCDAIGSDADVHTIAHALGLDKRIGSKFLHPGPGFGGYCLPKDTRAFIHIAKNFGEEVKTVEAAVAVNDQQYLRVVRKLRKDLSPLKGKTIAVLGLSFKPKTDDVRESRAIATCQALLQEGCALRVFDPAAMERAGQALASKCVTYCTDAYQAAESADGLIVCTEWNEFRNLDLGRVKELMRGDVLVDAKNIFDPRQAVSLGFRYYGMGRSLSLSAP